jgi:hypothetical protein
MTGDLTINSRTFTMNCGGTTGAYINSTSGNAGLSLSKAGGTFGLRTNIIGQTNQISGWQINIGDSTNEAGANAGKS